MIIFLTLGDEMHLIDVKLGETLHVAKQDGRFWIVEMTLEQVSQATYKINHDKIKLNNTAKNINENKLQLGGCASVQVRRTIEDKIKDHRKLFKQKTNFQSTKDKINSINKGNKDTILIQGSGGVVDSSLQVTSNSGGAMFERNENCTQSSSIWEKQSRKTTQSDPKIVTKGPIKKAKTKLCEKQEVQELVDIGY